jgi:hypothetical protein
VDFSPAAIMLARRHGAVALQGSVFEHVPGGGRWRTALLLDGNIGIGASPAALLRRVASLLAPRGEVLVELAAPGCGIVVHPLRLEHGDARSAWFAWAEVGVDAIAGPAAAGRLAVGDSWCDGGRWFALLERR